MNNNFEKDIEKILNEDVIIPDSVLEKKEMAFNKIRKNKEKKFSYRRKIIAAVIAMGIISGITFGNTTIAAIIDSLFPNNPGIQKAVDRGYVQNLENNTMKGNGVEIKAKSIIKDSKGVALSLKFKFDDKELLKYFKFINIDESIEDNNGKKIPTAHTTYDSSIDQETKEVTLVTVLEFWDDSNSSEFSEEELKNISSLKLKIDSIELVADASTKIDPSILPQLDNDTKEKLANSGVQLLKMYEGNWETNINLDDKFKEIKPIEYKASGNNDYINIVSAKIYPTGMKIIFSYKTQVGNLPQDTIYDDTITLTDDNSVTYKSDGFVGQSIGDNDKTNLTETFYVTTFDKTGDLKMIFKDLNGNTQEIKLTPKE